MNLPSIKPQSKAVIVAFALFSLGALAGISADRWLSARQQSIPQTGQLTVPAMARALDLDNAQQARVTELLQELEVQVAQATREGPAALQQAARNARQRLEEEIPPDRRDRFRSWMGEHRKWMSEQMCDDGMMESDWRNKENRERWRQWDH